MSTRGRARPGEASAPRRRLGVGPLLAAVVLIPTVALATFSGLAAAASWRTATAADQVDAQVDATAAVLDTWFALREERLPTEIVVATRALGVTPDVANEFVGFDVADRLAAARATVDAVDTSAVPALLPWKQRLVEFRSRLDRGQISPADSRGFFDSLDQAAASAWLESIREVGLMPGGHSDVTEIVRRSRVLEHAADALIAGAAETVLVSDVLLPLGRGGETSVRALASHRLMLQSADADMRDDLGPAGLAAYRALHTDPAAQSFARVIDQLTADPNARPSAEAIGTMSMTDLADIGPIIQSGLHRLELLDAVVGGAAVDLRASARSLRAATVDEVRRATALAVVPTLVALLLAALVARAIARPLRRLEHQAHAVSDGTLDLDDLDDRGPRQVAVAARAFNQLVANLRALEAQARLLASGDLHDPSLTLPLPGRLGASLHQSVDRLSQSLRDGERLRARLAHQATHDGLTGLLNRSGAIDALDRSILREGRRGRHTAVLFVDLDAFKAVNDLHGHATGDELLRVAAARLAEQARATDVVARLGGDEFVLILDGVADAGDALEVGERIVHRLAEPVAIDGRVLTVTASVGVALSDSTAEDALDLLRQADLAMYRAKAFGKRRVELYDESLQQQLRHRAAVEEELAEGLRLDQFELHYQPVVDATTGEMRRVEALVRWRRPSLGLALPSQFIPVAEQSDLIIDLDRRVLRTAAQQLASWRACGAMPGIGMSVNVSGRHLMHPSFVEHVLTIVDLYDIRPDELTIEVTETVLLQDLPSVASKLEELRHVGIRVAIDDFGTGYTSVGELRNLPADTIKVDQSFVSHLHDPRSGAILQLLVDLASMMGIEIVAEGVETLEQLDELRRRRCELVQGFYVSKALPADELEAWTASRAPGLVGAVAGS